MKSHGEVEKRLRKITANYARKYISDTQKREHANCKYNHEHSPQKRSEEKEVELQIAPRRTNSLVVIQSDAPIRLCMYGSEDPAQWSGLVCDNDDISRSCKYFIPLVSAEEAKAEFFDNLADDRFVFDNYKDIAAFQWMLNERVHNLGYGLLEGFFLWIRMKFESWFKPKILPPRIDAPQLPDGMWDSADEEVDVPGEDKP